MMIFWSWVVVICVYRRIAYLLVSFIPVEWNLIHLSCIMDGLPRGMDICHMEMGQWIICDNIVGIYFDVYMAVKFHRWACRAPELVSKAKLAPQIVN